MTTPTTPMTADDVLAVIADAGKFHRAAKDGTELYLAYTAVAAVYAERDALRRFVLDVKDACAPDGVVNQPAIYDMASAIVSRAEARRKGGAS